MVDEMKRMTEQVMLCHRDDPGRTWKAEVTIQMVQALASAAVERRCPAPSPCADNTWIRLSPSLRRLLVRALSDWACHIGRPRDAIGINMFALVPLVRMPSPVGSPSAC